jgi:hypothetical protein
LNAIDRNTQFGVDGQSGRGLRNESSLTIACLLPGVAASPTGLQEGLDWRFVGASALYFDGHFTRI